MPHEPGLPLARHRLSGRPGQDVQSEVGVGDRGLQPAVLTRTKPSVRTEHEVQAGRSLGRVKSMCGTKEPGWSFVRNMLSDALPQDSLAVRE